MCACIWGRATCFLSLDPRVEGRSVGWGGGGGKSRVAGAEEGATAGLADPVLLEARRGVFDAASGSMRCAEGLGSLCVCDDRSAQGYSALRLLRVDSYLLSKDNAVAMGASRLSSRVHTVAEESSMQCIAYG